MELLFDLEKNKNSDLAIFLKDKKTLNKKKVIKPDKPKSEIKQKKKREIQKKEILTNIKAENSGAGAIESSVVSKEGCKIYIDIRERDLWDSCMEISNSTDPEESYLHSLQFIKKRLDIGDILIENECGEPLLCIERKTVMDLLCSIKDGRYDEQSMRLMNSTSYASHHIIYLLEGDIDTFFTESKKIIYSALTSLSLYKGFSLFQTKNVKKSAEWLCHLVEKINRNTKKKKLFFYKNEILSPPLPEAEEQERDLITEYTSTIKVSKKENVTTDNIHLLMLCQIPGISIHTAKQILNGMTIKELIHKMESGDRWLYDLKIQSEKNNKEKKIGKNIVQSLYHFLSVSVDSSVVVAKSPISPPIAKEAVVVVVEKVKEVEEVKEVFTEANEGDAIDCK